MFNLQIQKDKLRKQNLSTKHTFIIDLNKEEMKKSKLPDHPHHDAELLFLI